MFMLQRQIGVSRRISASAVEDEHLLSVDSLRRTPTQVGGKMKLLFHLPPTIYSDVR